MNRISIADVDILWIDDGTLITPHDLPVSEEKFVSFNPDTDFMIKGLHYRRCTNGDECNCPAGSCQPITSFLAITKRKPGYRWVLSTKCNSCWRNRKSYTVQGNYHSELLIANYGVSYSQSSFPTFHSRYSGLIYRHKDDNTTSLTSPSLLLALWKAQDETCVISGWEMPVKYMHLDHIVPFHEGGGGNISNLVFIHKAINKSKGAWSLDKFCKWAGFSYSDVYSRIQVAHQRLRDQGFVFD